MAEPNPFARIKPKENDEDNDDSLLLEEENIECDGCRVSFPENELVKYKRKLYCSECLDIEKEKNKKKKSNTKSESVLSYNKKIEELDKQNKEFMNIISELSSKVDSLQNNFNKPLPSIINTEFEQVKQQQLVLGSKLNILDELREVLSENMKNNDSSNKSIIFYSCEQIVKYVRKRLKELNKTESVIVNIDKYTDKELSSISSQKKVFPNYANFNAEQKDLLKMLSRLERDGKFVERISTIQMEMNKKNFTS